MRIRHFVDPGLGNSAYLVISEADGVAALIDPLRDVDQYLDVARQEGVRITLRARRTLDDTEWERARSALNCELPTDREA